MLDAAAHASVSQAEQMIRAAFERKLAGVHKIRLENNVDNSSPSIAFTFVKDFVLGEGVYRLDEAAHVGCGHPCRPNMGQGIGCEYPRDCACLEYAAVDDSRITSADATRYEEYLQERENGWLVNTERLPKRFPYQKSSGHGIPSTLIKFHLESRHPIYECNRNCDCGPVCKSRVVQKGRRVPLVIFKTNDSRGWGVYCDEDLVRGEFIDTYIGEVLTNEETERREASMSGQARAIVSLRPRQYTVSYNKHDLRIYDLAFFAYEDIPAGTELTFDYQDKDEEEEEDVLKKRAAAA
ncbi:hypothetical protein LTR53_007520, partial [Teratosphaeriaceae sp. CCFEE 6253]